MSAAPLPRPDIERRQGWAPIPNQCLWDWARLVSGDAQVFSILFINSEIHTLRKKGTSVPKWTRTISNEEFAQFARCTVRAIEIALGDLLKRKVIERKKSGKGFAYGISFESWPELPDRPPKVVPITGAQPAEEESEEEANKPRGEVVAVFDKPQTVRAGGRTRPKSLPSAAGKLQFEAESEIQFDARMCDGVLTVRAKSEAQHRTKGEDKRNVFRSNDTQVQSNQRNDNFHVFEAAWLNRGINAAPDDWTEARSTWNILSAEERLRAVQGVTDRFEQGEYDDPKFIPLPQNYLRKKLWMRPVRPRKKPDKVKIHKDDATAFATLDLARRLDQEVARRNR